MKPPIYLWLTGAPTEAQADEQVALLPSGSLDSQRRCPLDLPSKAVQPPGQSRLPRRAHLAARRLAASRGTDLRAPQDAASCLTQPLLPARARLNNLRYQWPGQQQYVQEDLLGCKVVAGDQPQEAAIGCK
eukprot:CAMPEP_0113683974 /NCGR_PEP_ID=MMETSP0038_2-20120614/13683_1 /TAXON_ID=2898 /ORGANISM="Cryptomonas paramecium" /LENGTH=130 /DNA_ID=CAMNT_0000603547 /DNA_START=1519 /DNA_END=1910 /DNA_ORIENTATION=- /assembly_acc=CAM_ASM_000170